MILTFCRINAMHLIEIEQTLFYKKYIQGVQIEKLHPQKLINLIGV